MCLDVMDDTRIIACIRLYTFLHEINAILTKRNAPGDVSDIVIDGHKDPPLPVY